MLESLFNPDNAFMSFINKIIDLVVLSLVWLVCCMPIITIGPACAALYYAVTKAVRRKRSYPVTEFWRAFKSNLKKGVIFEVIWVLFAGMMLYTDVPLILSFWDTGKVQDMFLLVLFVVKAFLLLGTACWVYPLMSRFEEPLFKLTQSAVFILVRYFPITIAAVALSVFSVMLYIAEPLLLAVLPGMFMLALSFLQEPVLRKLCQASVDEADFRGNMQVSADEADFRGNMQVSVDEADSRESMQVFANDTKNVERAQKASDTTDAWYLEK